MNETLRKFTEDEERWLDRAMRSCYGTRFSNIIDVRQTVLMSDDDIQIAPSFDGSLFGQPTHKPMEFVILASPKNKYLGDKLFRRIKKIQESPLWRTLND